MALSIKNWAEEDRPREKLLAKGIESLTNAELIAILIGSGNKNETAVELAKRVLNSTGKNLNELAKLTVADLTRFKGIGEAKAISIVVALELGRRRKSENVIENKKITSSEHVFELFYPILADLPHEEFWAVFLSRSNIILDKQQISKGGVASTVFDAKIMFKTAIEKLASSVVLCHNHPSGSLKPSDHDKNITRKVKEAGKLMEIALLDHLIITSSGYFSFADEGLM